MGRPRSWKGREVNEGYCYTWKKGLISREEALGVTEDEGIVDEGVLELDYHNRQYWILENGPAYINNPMNEEL